MTDWTNDEQRIVDRIRALEAEHAAANARADWAAARAALAKTLEAEAELRTLVHS